jgi:hypothetical protein
MRHHEPVSQDGDLEVSVGLLRAAGVPRPDEDGEEQ